MKTLVLSAIGAVVLVGGASAAPAPAPSPRLFLSPSGEPFRATPSAPDPLKIWFDQVDVKHQGYIDREEFRADAVRFFKRLDENGDGVLDGFEVADYEHKLVPELLAEAQGRIPGQSPGDHGGASGGPGGGEGGGHPRGRGDAHRGQESGNASAGETGSERGKGPAQRGILQLIGEPEPVSGADFNLDSRITLDEWMRATDQRFEILDEAKDGKLTLEELKARFLPKPKGQ